jgi:hypothetical protein
VFETHIGNAPILHIAGTGHLAGEVGSLATQDTRKAGLT